MSDARQSVQPGQPLKIAASQINFLNRLMAGETSVRSGPMQGWRFGGNVILARNDSGEDIPRWGVMKSDGVVIDPNDDDTARREFEAMPCVIGNAASTGEAKAIIAIEPIKYGEIGRVAVAGVVQIKAEDVEKVGSASELWREGDWALIRFGGGGGGVRLGKTTTAWLRDTSCVIDIWDKGEPLEEEISSPLKTVTAYNKFYDVAACVWVIVENVKGRWYLVEAATPDPSESGCNAPNISGHDLTTVSGYASNKRQALTHDDNACLQWVDIEDCA